MTVERAASMVVARPADRIDVTGLPVDAVSKEQLFAYAIEAAKAGRGPMQTSGRGKTIAYLNIHVANCAAEDDRLKTFLTQMADLVYCDGNGIAWGAVIGGHPRPPRMTAADWLPELLLAMRQAGLRVFAIGGQPGVLDRAAQIISTMIGGLGPFASHHGYLDGNLSEELLKQIAAFQPDVVFAGMGTPAQEHWLLRYRDRIDAPVVWAIGAAFDYFGGQQQRGPGIFGRIGQEWIGRLLSDPRRLWRRYLLGNPRFLMRAMMDRLHAPRGQ